MSISPILTFKAGICDLDDTMKPYKISPKLTPGYIYLYNDDGLYHFCWRPRAAPLNEAPLDLIMLPGDGSFKPYEGPASSSGTRALTNGRIFVLKFSSSSSRHLFWLQSRSQHPSGDPSWFSPRDVKLGQIVDKIIQGEEVNVEQEIANIPNTDGDDDATMEDAEDSRFGTDHHRAASGGAGADATGGDIRDEGEESREGGADGGRATAPLPNNAEVAIANFLRSMQGSALSRQQQGAPSKLFTTLPDLLRPSSTLPIIDSMNETHVDELLTHVPQVLLLLACGIDGVAFIESSSDLVQTAMESLSLEQKKDILRKTIRSPQFIQSLASLTTALRDGGLPNISDALNVKVVNNGFTGLGTMPLGSGEAVEAFLNGIKESVEDEPNSDERLDTD